MERGSCEGDGEQRQRGKWRGEERGRKKKWEKKSRREKTEKEETREREEEDNLFSQNEMNFRSERKGRWKNVRNIK